MTGGASLLRSRPPDAGPRAWRTALLATQLGEGRVRCGLCPYECDLAPGQTGPCSVRRNDGGTLVTAGFAVSVAHVDPIERKPLYHVRPGTKVLTIAAPGCTFRCNYCINHKLSQYGRLPGLSWTAQPADVDALVARAKAEASGLAFSYTEPALAIELTAAVALRSRAAGMVLVWKTNGFLTARAIDLVAPMVDAVNIDVKAADDAAHRRLTGAPLSPVFDAVERFAGHGVWVEVSTPLIPTISDEPAQWRRIAGHLVAISRDIPWHLLRFTPDFRMGRHPPTPPERLRQARDAGREAGLSYVYVERALGEDGRQTRCPGCDAILIDRGLWQAVSSIVRDGYCPECQTMISGRWG